MTQNHLVRLKSRPSGMATRDNFTIVREPVASPGDGQIAIETRFISLDPAMRGWMSEGRSYVPPVGLGDVMRAFAAGHVLASRHPDFGPGNPVVGLFGVQSHPVVDAALALKVDTGQAPLERWIGGLGMPGWTAYFGLLEVGQPKTGETLVVSAASGAVGSVVGQIGKIQGLRVVGIAGGEEKCRYLTEELGFDAAVDYKAGNLAADLESACPDGIDVYFENVGGAILDAVLARMNPFGRIVVCGLISAYNATRPPPGPGNLRYVLVNRLRVQGIIVLDWAKRYPEAIAALGRWHAEGKLKLREDVRDGGIDAYPDVLNLLYTGGNFGKLVLRV
ncbi:MAG: NADP-dependent oxidoreductase [Acidithiobacillales bacterium]